MIQVKIKAWKKKLKDPLIILVIYLSSYKTFGNCKCHYYTKKMENIPEATDSRLVDFF